MVLYLGLASGNLVASLIVFGWLKAAFPDPALPFAGISPGIFWPFLGIYLFLGPIPFLILTRRLQERRRPAVRLPIYLTAFLHILTTVAFSLEFHRYLVKVRIPLVVMDPSWIILNFLGFYLPATLLLCYVMSRYSRMPQAVKPALLGPGHGITIPAPVAQPGTDSIPVSPVRETLSPDPAGSFSTSRNELTLDRMRFINRSSHAEISGDPGLMETLDLSKLKRIQDDFSTMTGLSLLSFGNRGELLCDPSLENPICRTLQTTDEGRHHCKSHCGRSVSRALQGNETQFFKCDMNLHVFTIPIILDDKTRLVFQGGKSFFESHEFADSHPVAARMNIDTEELEKRADPIRVTEMSGLVSPARFLESVLPYLFSTLHSKKRLDSKFSRLMTLFTLTADLKNNLPQLVNTFLNTLGILFNLNTASVLLREPGGSNFKTVATFGQKIGLIRDYQSDGMNELIQRLFHRKSPVSTDETIEILQMGFPAGITSVHLFPLLSQDNRVTSILCIFDTPLSDEDTQVITAFCQQVALIQDNARLHQDRGDLAKDMSILMDISRTVGSALDSDELFSIILDKSTQFLQAEQGSLLILNEEKEEMTVKAIKGLNKKIVELLRIRPGEGISGRVFSSGSPLIVADIESDDRVIQPNRPRYRTKSFISIPLKLDSRTIGVLNLSDKITGEIFSEEDLQLLTSIGAYASVAIERSMFYKKTEELKKISITDPLTGLLNRRYLQERMSEEIERFRRHTLPLSLIMIDLDDFKSINDTLGHITGDEVLKIASRSIRDTIRTIDVAARYGGEEFSVILPQTSKEDAHIIAERICSEARHLDFPFSRMGKKLSLTMSLGLATFGEDADSLEQLVRNADIALYSAKSQGKDRVVVYES